MNSSKLFLLFLIFLLAGRTSFAQGTTCATATSVTVNGACAPSVTLTDATADAPLPSCGTTAREGWYTFTLGAPASVTIVGTNANRNLALQLISGTCGSLTQLVCENASGPGAGTETISGYALAAGTYFVKVLNVGSNDINLTSLCITSGAAGPANDNPTGATPLTVGASCVYTTYTNAGATATTCGTIPAPGCSSYLGGDVWFSVVVPAGGALLFDSQTGVMTDGGMAVYSGTPCGAMTLIACDDDASTNGLMAYLSLSGLTPGATLYVRFWEYGNDNNGTFGLCVTTPPPPPANDNCGGATALTVNPDFLCGTVTPGTIASSTASPDANSCFGTDDDDVWFSFVATGPSHTISLLNVMGSTTDLYHAVYTGTCGSLGAALLCSDPNNSTLTGLTAGVTYYVRVYSWTATGGQTTTFNVCIGTPPPPPANDNCGGAIALTVNPDFMCGTVTPGTIASATASPEGTTCGGTDDDDVWFSFVAVGTSHTVDLLNITGGTTDLYHAVFTGTCGSLGAPLICSDPNNSTLTGLTPGVTYYVRVYSWTATAGQTSAFNICIGTPPPPPANDNCGGAVALTVNPDQLCGTVTAGTIASASASPDANSCFGTDDDDVWFSFVATAPSHDIDLLNVTGSTTDLYHSVFTGSCGSLGTALLCSDPNFSTLTGLTIGVTYYVRVYSWTATAGQTTSFNICIGTPPPSGPCGNPVNNDYCSNPAVLTYNPGSSWTSTTSPLFTGDIPANLGGVFCGSIENNSWYQFVASSTTHTFVFSNITNCSNNWGVQAQVYNVTTNGSLCCTNFASVSNCYNPGTTTGGTVTATGLTVGNTYYLMVDGNAGDDCDFSVGDWSASGILPIELISFTGEQKGVSNLLQWITASELNNDFFTIEKSPDGIHFENILEADGAGNSNVNLNYSAVDNFPFSGLNYYRLKQTDYDGQHTYSNIILIENKLEGILVSNVHPNPTTEDINFDIYTQASGNVRIQILDYTGRIVMDEIQTINEGKSSLNTTMKTLAKGLYTLKVEFGNGQHPSLTKVIKQ